MVSRRQKPQDVSGQKIQIEAKTMRIAIVQTIVDMMVESLAKHVLSAMVSALIAIFL